MATKIHMGMIDHSGELTGFNFNFPDIAANGSNWPTLFAPTTGQYDLVKAAVALATKLNLTRSTAGITVEQSVGSLPADATAQREMALRIFYADDVTGDKYRFDLPAPDDGLVPSGTDEVPTSNVAFAALIAVLEANVVSPDGNAITVIGGRIVGRRN